LINSVDDLSKESHEMKEVGEMMLSFLWRTPPEVNITLESTEIYDWLIRKGVEVGELF
jgi:hypothetical protein